MKRTSWAAALIATSLLGGCAMTVPTGPQSEVGPGGIGFGYYPLDPLPVQISVTGKDAILALLPDETIRMAVGELTADGGITFGPARLGTASRNYVVIVDYMKYTTQVLPATITLDPQTQRKVASIISSPKPSSTAPLQSSNAAVPIYIGIGLRMTASLRVLKGEVDLGNLIGLGAAAKAEQITGTLIVQNMGIGSRTTTDLLPMPSAINDASIQAAIIALSAIKAKVYDATDPVPRVLGIYNTLGGDQSTINGIISGVLSDQPSFPVKVAAATSAPTPVVPSLPFVGGGGTGQPPAVK